MTGTTRKMPTMVVWRNGEELGLRGGRAMRPARDSGGAGLAPEHGAGRGLVPPHLGDQRVHAIEGRVPAQALEEINRDGLAVEIAVEVEDVRLDLAGARVDGRARADVGHRRAGT